MLAEDTSQQQESYLCKCYLNIAMLILELSGFQDLFSGHHSYCVNLPQEHFLSKTMCP